MLAYFSNVAIQQVSYKLIDYMYAVVSMQGIRKWTFFASDFTSSSRQAADARLRRARLSPARDLQSVSFFKGASSIENRLAAHAV
jgi:hypothetical protein